MAGFAVDTILFGVDLTINNIVIAHAEQFQNDFVLKDEHIQDVEKNIKGHQENLQKAYADKAAPDQKTCRMQENLRNEISYLEAEFSNLKARS